MAVFHVNVIVHTVAALSVTISDAGSPPVTYQQVKNSLGSYVYKVEGLYLYSENMNQLIGVIQYNRFDVNGDQKFTPITTTIDPYQMERSLFKDLKPADTAFILNGNSSFSTTLLPQTYLQLKLYTKRITSSFGRNLGAFKLMELLDRKPDFFANYGDYNGILLTNAEVEKTAVLKYGDNIPSNPHSTDGTFVLQDHEASLKAGKAFYDPKRNASGNGNKAAKQNKKSATGIEHDEDVPVLLASVAAISFGVYLMTKKN